MYEGIYSTFIRSFCIFVDILTLCYTFIQYQIWAKCSFKWDYYFLIVYLLTREWDHQYISLSYLLCKLTNNQVQIYMYVFKKKGRFVLLLTSVHLPWCSRSRPSFNSGTTFIWGGTMFLPVNRQWKVTLSITGIL